MMTSLTNPASMIASLSGEVLSLGLDFAVIECAGVGYTINITADSAAQLQLGDNVRVYTALIVREDSMTLYGFREEAERSIFYQLQTVSGVGPRLALAVLTALSPEELYHAFAQADAPTLTKVPGVGKRVAERLIMELKDKVPPYGVVLTAHGGTNRPATKTVMVHPQQDVIDALQGLGFGAVEATETIDALAADNSELALSGNPAQLIKQALAVLGKNK